MDLLPSVFEVPGLYLFYSALGLVWIWLVALRVPYRVMLAVLVLLPALPLLLVRTAALQLAALCDWVVERRPWTRPLAWAAREVDHYISR